MAIMKKIIFLLIFLLVPGVVEAKKKKRNKRYRKSRKSGKYSKRKNRRKRKKRKKRKKRRKLDYRCLSRLRMVGVKFKKGPYKVGMHTPVTILNGRLGGIQYMNGTIRARPVMDCRAALAFHRVGPIFRANGGIKVLLVGKFYSYRNVKNTNRLSRHALGLAMDLYGVRTANGKTYEVTHDYKRWLGSGKYCEGKAKTRGARILRQLACDLDSSGYFKSILTPDSDREHRDHFHLSVYNRRERRKRPTRTVLLESFNLGRWWVKRLPKHGYPSKKRVWRIVKARRRANRRVIKRLRREKRRRARKKRGKRGKKGKRGKRRRVKRKSRRKG
jgi:hypothetical protein